MKRIWCCILSLLMLFACAATACSPSKGSSESTFTAEECELSLTTKTYKIEDGQTVPLEVSFTVDGKDVNKALLSYASSDENIATVDLNGNVTGVTEGKAYITVSYGEKSVKATVNVTLRVNKMKLSHTSVLLPIGKTKKVSATVQYGLTKIENPSLVWESSDTTVATVENGVITAVSNGKANVTVTYEDVKETIVVESVAEATAAQVNTFSEEYVNIYGRSYISNDALSFDHCANAIEIGVVGDSFSVEMSSTIKSYMRVFVDGATTSKKIDVKGNRETYQITDLGEGYHKVRLVKVTEMTIAGWSIFGFEAEKFFVMPEKSDLKIEFVGDSITVGYGVMGYVGQDGNADNTDCSKAYSYVAARELNADYSIVAVTGICAKTNQWTDLNMMSVYPNVSTRNGNAYSFDEPADVVVLNLGTNEATHLSEEHGQGADAGPAYAQIFPTHYKEMLTLIRKKNPNAYIICLYGMIEEFTAISTGIKIAIGEMEDEKIVYNPFSFRGDFNGAGRHPSSVAQKEWGEDLADYIRTLL